MQASHPYEEIRNILIDQGFYPCLSTIVKNKTKIIQGIQVDSPPILKDERGERLRRIVGTDYIVSWEGNGETNNHFLIRKK